MAKLPVKYLENMQKLLGSKYEEFLQCYDKKPLKALRFNTRKVRKETIDKLISEWKLRPVPWCTEGYYYDESDEIRPGLSPYHEAGVFYIQEPSAMITGSAVEFTRDDIVLDLCAAPGGKSTQIAAKAGLLVSNEPIAKRSRILSSNIERLGFDNVIVTESYPNELECVLPCFFDKIVIDAPCSGEGMMRKDDTAIFEWSEDNVRQCVERQSEILESAYSMLKPGGMIIYSTCTFEVDENEGQISHFLSLHDDMKLLSTERLYPHEVEGEGHFCAVMISTHEKAADAVSDLISERERITALLKKRRIHVLRSGIERGEIIKNRNKGDIYIPSHAEMHDVNKNISNIDNHVDLHDINDAEKYLKGDVLSISDICEHDSLFTSKGGAGFVSVCFDGYVLGLGKMDENGRIKNHYPKGLRHL